MNQSEHELHDQGYSERFVRQEMLKVQKIPRNELLENENSHQEY